jgi:hypothetical protein
VDVDGEAWLNCSFANYSFDDKSFVIYAVGRSAVTKSFEGASQALK